jgi:hypothetical protein
MELTENDPGSGQVPEAGTLPAAEQPLRVAAFEALFAGAVRGVDRAGPSLLRLDLQDALRHTCDAFTPVSRMLVRLW